MSASNILKLRLHNTGLGLSQFKIAIVNYRMMASVEDKLDALVNAKVYKSRDEVISDAMSALFTLKPRLKIDMAVNLYRNKKVRLWRAADIASLTLEQFKDMLTSRSIRIEIEGDEDSIALLKKMGFL